MMADVVNNLMADKLENEYELSIAYPDDSTPEGRAALDNHLMLPRCALILDLKPAFVRLNRNTEFTTKLPNGDGVSGYILSTDPPRTNFAHLYTGVTKFSDDPAKAAKETATFLAALKAKFISHPEAPALFNADHSRVPDVEGAEPFTIDVALDVLIYHAVVKQFVFTPRASRYQTRGPVVGTALYIFPFSLDNEANILAFYSILSRPEFRFRAGLTSMACPWWGVNPSKAPMAMSCWECFAVDHYADLCPVKLSHAYQVMHARPNEENTRHKAPSLVTTAAPEVIASASASGFHPRGRGTMRGRRY
jgi:hypothetical protein